MVAVGVGVLAASRKAYHADYQNCGAESKQFHWAPVKLFYSADTPEKENPPQVLLEGDFKPMLISRLLSRGGIGDTQRSGFPGKPGLQQAVLRRIYTGLAL